MFNDKNAGKQNAIDNIWQHLTTNSTPKPIWHLTAQKPRCGASASDHLGSSLKQDDARWAKRPRWSSSWPKEPALSKGFDLTQHATWVRDAQTPRMSHYVPFKMVIWTIVGGFQFSNTTSCLRSDRTPSTWPIWASASQSWAALTCQLYPLISPHAGFGGWVKTLVPWFSPQESCSVDTNHRQKGTRGLVGPPSIGASETMQGGWKWTVLLLTECWRVPTYNKVVCRFAFHVLEPGRHFTL